MYLTELVRFYDRMSSNPNSGMPIEGMSSEGISFVIILSDSGEMKGIRDLRDTKGKPTKRFVPAAVKRAVNIKPNFLWDKTDYALGVSGKDESDKVPKRFQAFRDFHKKMLGSCSDAGAKALLSFLDEWNPESFSELEEAEAMLDTNIVFQLEGDTCFLHEREALRELWLDSLSNTEGEKARCLITGKTGVIARIHPAIKGLLGAQPAGAALISFKCAAFTSYGKEQSFNAPVSERSSRAYVTALNYLLQREHNQCVRIGGDTVVFWTDKPCAEESLFSSLFGISDNKDSIHEQDQEKLNALEGALSAMARGVPLNKVEGLDTDVRFFVLCLVPNAARIGVRFWVTDTLGKLLERFGRWYCDLHIEPQFSSEPERPAIWQILKDLAPLQKTDNISPLWGSQLLRAILTGKAYPQSLFTAALQRIYADKKVTYFRAALIKALLCCTNKEVEDMTSLNTESQSQGYQLGRLFAVLNKVQEDAIGEVGASMRDRYIGAASARPALVFPQILHTAQYHLSKLSKDKPGLEVNRSKLIGEIMASINEFPAVLSLEEQGRFMIGFYHQNNALYQKTDNSKATTQLSF